MARPLRDRLTQQCIQALGRLAFAGVEVDMIRVQKNILGDLREALGDTSLAGKVNQTLDNQTRSIMYVYSGAPAAKKYVEDQRKLGRSQAVADGTGFTAFRKRRFSKTCSLKPVGILVPATWSQFAQQLMDATMDEKNDQHRKSYEEKSAISRMLDEHERRPHLRLGKPETVQMDAWNKKDKNDDRVDALRYATTRAGEKKK